MLVMMAQSASMTLVASSRPQAYFKNGNIEQRMAHQPQNCQGREFEIGQGDFFPLGSRFLHSLGVWKKVRRTDDLAMNPATLLGSAQDGAMCTPVRYPACSATASSIAQVDPFPLVPATVMTGQLNFNAIRCATSRTRSKPISMPTG